MKRLIALAALCSVALTAGCNQDTRAEWRSHSPKLRANMRRVTGGGDTIRGRDAMRRYGCQACHTIPGVPGGRANVGPPLAQFATRTYIAGELPNSPPNLLKWIQSPHSVEPHTLMPDMGVKENDARDISAYLYTLR